MKLSLQMTATEPYHEPVQSTLNLHTLFPQKAFNTIPPEPSKLVSLYKKTKWGNSNVYLYQVISGFHGCVKTLILAFNASEKCW
jgi:hypothetical protein